jgi:hypothetical protein
VLHWLRPLPAKYPISEKSFPTGKKADCYSAGFEAMAATWFPWNRAAASSFQSPLCPSLTGGI